MKRKDFIRNTALFSLATSALGLSGLSTLQANPLHNKVDLVAIKGGEPAQMFDKAIEAFGGLNRVFKKGANVLVKPNIGWDVPPERAANTNPQLVKRVVQACYEAGAKKVYVFDNTCDTWTRAYLNSGIEKAVKDAGGVILPGNSEKNYQTVKISNGKKLTETKVHELVLETDAFINIPVLKHHGSGKLTIAMKNLMGIVWDRGYWHRNDLHQCIADFCLYSKPHLNIVDAYNVMMQNGPRGVSVNDIVQMKSMIISSDIVAADAASTRIFGMEPANVPYIKYADEMKIGTMDLSKLNIKRINL